MAAITRGQTVSSDLVIRFLYNLLHCLQRTITFNIIKLYFKQKRVVALYVHTQTNKLR